MSMKRAFSDRPARKRGGTVLAALGALGLTLPLAVGVPAAFAEVTAEPILVTDGGDSGPGTLRAAIEQAEANPGPDTIEIADGLNVVVTTGGFSLPDEVTIAAPLGGRATITAAVGPESWYYRPLFQVNGAQKFERLNIVSTLDNILATAISGTVDDLAVTEVTFTDWESEAISAEGNWSASRTDGSIRLSGVRIQGKGGGAGGVAQLGFDGSLPVFIEGTQMSADSVLLSFYTTNAMVVTNSHFLGNGQEQDYPCVVGGTIPSATSGDIVAAGGLHIANNVFSGCNTEGDYLEAGALVAGSGNPNGPHNPVYVLVEGNTFSNNTGNGADHLVVTAGWSDGPANIMARNNTFISDPERSVPAVLASSLSPAHFSFEHNTLVGAGIGLSGASMEEGETTASFTNNAIDSGGLGAVARGASSGQLGTVQVSEASGNVVTDRGELLPDGFGVVRSGDEFMLGELAQNGNPFLPLTREPLAGSALIDAGVLVDGLSEFDQRGAARVQGAAPDAGAVETATLPVSVQLDRDVRVAEGEDAVFTVTRSGSETEAAEVRVRTADGSAVSGTDYEPVDEVLVWAPGEKEAKTVRVVTVANAPVDPERTFTVALSDPAVGTVIGDPGEVAGVIVDDVPVGGGDPDPGGPSEPGGSGKPGGPGVSQAGGSLSATGGVSGVAAGVAAAGLVGVGVLLAVMVWARSRRTRS